MKTISKAAAPGVKRGRIVMVTLFLVTAALWTLRADSPPAWKLTKESEKLVTDAKLRDQIFRALDAAEKAGTDPHISKFKVRAATGLKKMARSAWFSAATRNTTFRRRSTASRRC